MTTLPQTTFSSHRRLTHSLADLWRYRDLLVNLTVSELKVRYKHSMLGVLWSLLNPLLMMLVFTFVFTKLLPNTQIPHFYVFVLVGLLPWNFFQGAVMGSASQVVGNSNLIKKVYFPREVLPIATVMSNFVNFLLGLIPLTFFLIVSGIGITPHVLWLPLIFVIQLLLVLGLGLLFSAITVFYRDLLMVLEVALLGLFFMTPIFYPMELGQQAATILGVSLPVERLVRWLNPMASIVDAYHTVLYGVISYSGGEEVYFAPSAPALDFLLRTGVTSVLVFLVGWWFFRRVSPSFGEEV